VVAHVRPTTSRRAGPPRPRAHVNTHLPTAGRRLERQVVWLSRVAVLSCLTFVVLAAMAVRATAQQLGTLGLDPGGAPTAQLVRMG